MKNVKGRLTLLADNIVSGKAESLGEDGFSVFIETDYGNFLFDTGRGTTIVHNSIVHKKNLGLLNKIILRHGCMLLPACITDFKEEASACGSFKTIRRTGNWENRQGRLIF